MIMSVDTVAGRTRFDFQRILILGGLDSEGYPMPIRFRVV